MIRRCSTSTIRPNSIVGLILIDNTVISRKREELLRFSSARTKAFLTRARSRDGGKEDDGAPCIMVVESPTKAKKIQKFLGPSYKVFASYGHVRDLPPRQGSVLPDQNFQLVWELSPGAGPRLTEISQALSGSRMLLLATDPDREGEAISWHVTQELQRRGVLSGVPVQRITFNEITQSAVQAAIQQPRQVSVPLVDAYLARRALDWLVGFNISPLLWRKLPGARSAGRVQSVALRLVSNREAEVERFVPQQYWTVESRLRCAEGRKGDSSSGSSGSGSSGSSTSFPARLVTVDGQKLGALGLSEQQAAASVTQRLEAAVLQVHSVSRKPQQRNPPAPFITSTLQQEASHRLGLSASSTMQVAQQLYEGAGMGEGLITYMRTDGVTISAEGAEQIRSTVAELYGNEYVHAGPPRVFKSRQKNAQEAHEAIRPTNAALLPTDVKLREALTPEQLALYGLIWRRALACQMSNAVVDQIAVDISGEDGQLMLRANAAAVQFQGYLAVYNDDDASAGSSGSSSSGTAAEAGGTDGQEEGVLPLAQDGTDVATAKGSRVAPGVLLQLKEGAVIEKELVSATGHLTKAPARYTEASLIKTLEELGIGRPSTYAPVVHLLQARHYVVKEGRALRGTSLGRVLTAFMEHYFSKYVDPGFTSSMEELLDEVSGGRAQWRAVLSDFWRDFHVNLTSLKDLSQTDVYNMLDQDLSTFLFPPSASPGGPDPRACPACGTGRLTVKPSKAGGFIGCTNFAREDEQSRCKYSRSLVAIQMRQSVSEDGTVQYEMHDPTQSHIGLHPDNGLAISVRSGPYGLYVQLGEETDFPAEPAAAGDGKEEKKKRTRAKKGDVKQKKVKAPKAAGPKRVSLPKGKDATNTTLAEAVALLSLPRLVGSHPDDGGDVVVNTGRFGPYVLHDGVFATLGRHLSLEDITLEQALERLQARKERIAAGGTKKKTSKSKVPAVRRANHHALARKAFCRALRSKLKATQPELAGRDLTVLMGQRWDALSVDARQALVEQAAAAQLEAGASAAAAAAAGASAAAAGGGAATATGGATHVDDDDDSAAGDDDASTVGGAAPPIQDVLDTAIARQRSFPTGAAATGAAAKTRGGAATGAAAKLGGGAAPAAGRGKARQLQNVVPALAAPKGRRRASADSSVGTSDNGASSAAPSTPRSGYMAFCSARRAAVRGQHPEASAATMMQLLAAEWRGLGDADKAQYNQMAKGDRAGGQELVDSSSGGESAAAPSRPRSGYMAFSSERRAAVRAQNPEASAATMMQLLAAEWRGLGDSEKAQYNQMAKGDRAGGQELVDSSSGGESAAAPSRPRSGYMAFCSARRASVRGQHPEASAATMMQLLAAEWRGLGDADKARYNQAAKGQGG